MVQCCIENIEDFLLINPINVFSSERELAKFCSFILEVIISSQPALQMAGYVK